MIIDLYLFAVCGALFGVLVGMLPGLSNSVAMIMAFPLLMLTGPINAVAFYIALITVSSYTGSVSATLLGVAGEAGSMPALKEGLAMNLRGEANLALGSAAVGSFIGSSVGVTLSMIIYWIGAKYYALYSFPFQLTMLLAVALITFFGTNRDSRFVTFWLILAGLLLGRVGFNAITNEHFLTFDNVYLMQGIPLLPVMIFLYSIPILANLNSQSMSQSCKPNTNIVWRIQIPWLTTLRSSVVGFFCGFTPILSNIMSSNVAYSIEKFLLGNKYRRDGDLRALVASESANNAGNIACLIPLLAFGIPIVASEAVLFEITNAKGLIYSLDWVLKNFHWIAGTFLVANVIGFVCAWPLAQILSRIVSLFSNYFKWVIIIVLILICFWAGWREAQAMYYMTLAAIFLPIGLLLRKFDLLPLVIMFMLSTLIETNALIVWKLYTG
jgi:TctA family transporter